MLLLTDGVPDCFPLSIVFPSSLNVLDELTTSRKQRVCRSRKVLNAILLPNMSAQSVLFCVLVCIRTNEIHAYEKMCFHWRLFVIYKGVSLDRFKHSPSALLVSRAITHESKSGTKAVC